jgi:hypothetical protein
MWQSGRDTLVESTMVLILIGMLAGAVGGLGVGLIAQHSPTPSTATSH